MNSKSSTSIPIYLGHTYVCNGTKVIIQYDKYQLSCLALYFCIVHFLNIYIYIFINFQHSTK